MNQSVILRLSNITKHYPHRGLSTEDYQSTLVLDDVSLSLNHGELLGLLGPSGCGKTTLLRVVAGFESISRGSVSIAGKVVATNCESLAAEKRNTGMVFQDYALFPHLTVAENIAFGLKNQSKYRKKSIFPLIKTNAQIKQRIGAVLDLVGLSGLERRYPHQLSGGQQQRISLARALAPQPALILLDEPLSNLDVQVRHRLRAEIRAIIKAAGISAIFVTHDREEALAISDKIAVMRQGRIEQIGTPEEIYLDPASRFVAEFVTQANFLPATKNGRLWQTEIGGIEVSEISQAYFAPNSQITSGDLMLRPEDINLIPDADSQIIVQERQFLGREYYYCVITPSGKRIYVRTAAHGAISVGTKVSLSLAMTSPKVFAISSEQQNATSAPIT